MNNLVTIEEVKKLTQKRREDTTFLGSVSKAIRKAAESGIYDFVDIQVYDKRDQRRQLLWDTFKGFTVGPIHEHVMDDDPFHGKTYNYTVRISW